MMMMMFERKGKILKPIKCWKQDAVGLPASPNAASLTSRLAAAQHALQGRWLDGRQEQTYGEL